ncbi:Nucleotide-binding, alpha-beta plait [Artemisia annua]|uniref:Nucleotide-binding, alpha-beta plait n=1 Tax=Artemisia annua TaxID=35608 RepID=A0A2U1MKT2_ARTAN|nr:Nucleotide-binding, alpha-beta plait [Artemisia annua]
MQYLEKARELYHNQLLLLRRLPPTEFVRQQIWFVQAQLLQMPRGHPPPPSTSMDRSQSVQHIRVDGHAIIDAYDMGGTNRRVQEASPTSTHRSSSQHGLSNVHVDGEVAIADALNMDQTDDLPVSTGLTATQLSDLPLTKYCKDEEGVDCAICICELEENEMVPVLACKHKFHENCIKQWLERQNLCPLWKCPHGQSQMVYPSSFPENYQFQNQLSFLSLDDQIEHANESNFPNYYYEPTSSPRINRRSLGLPEFPVKICHYFLKGCCMYGNSCRYSHGSLENLEMELIELLNSTGFPVSIASLPMLYYEKFGETLQTEGHFIPSNSQYTDEEMAILDALNDMDQDTDSFQEADLVGSSGLTETQISKNLRLTKYTKDEKKKIAPYVYLNSKITRH